MRGKKQEKEQEKEQGVQVVLDMFDGQRAAMRELLADVVDDADAAYAASRAALEALAPDSAYLDAPQSPLASALFFCTFHLAAYLAVRTHGVDAHTYGKAMLEQLARLELSPLPGRTDEELAADFQGPGTHPGEFEVEVVDRSEGAFDYGYNIKSCAICHLYGKHDAMDLVPYMCASDDVMSDLRGEGLRRTGTIALGAHQCDFRYEADGKPGRVAEAHPDKIRFVHA